MGYFYIVSDGEIEKLKTKNRSDSKVTSHLPLLAPLRDVVCKHDPAILHAVPGKRWRYLMPNRMWWCMMFPKKEILSKSSLITKDAYETFPSFSADGKWPYFCSAPALTICVQPA